MFRLFISGFLLLAVAGEASAQAAPARATTTNRRPVSKVLRPAATPKVAAERRVANEAPGSQAPTTNVYAAPGMPVNVQRGKVDPYDGKKPTKPAHTTKSNTLNPR